MEQIRVVVAPELEPLTLAQAKAHLRVDHNLDDELVARALTAAREQVEAEARRVCGLTTFEWELDGFPEQEWGGYWDPRIRRMGPGPGWVPSSPGSCPLTLPRSPAIAVVEVRYRDPAGVDQVMPAHAYRTRPGIPGRVQPVGGWTWPQAARDGGAVTMQFWAGYSSPAAVPEALKFAILLHLGTLYAQGESIVVGATVTPLGDVVQRLIDSVIVTGR